MRPCMVNLRGFGHVLPRFGKGTELDMIAMEPTAFLAMIYHLMASDEGPPFARTPELRDSETFPVRVFAERILRCN